MLYLRAGVEVEILGLKRMLHLKQARYRLRYESDHKTVKSLDAAMVLSPEIKKMQKKISQLEIREIALDAVISGYENIVKAASREMSRRGVEASNTSKD